PYCKYIFLLPMQPATAPAQTFYPAAWPTSTSAQSTTISQLLPAGQKFELLSLHVGMATTEALFFAREDSLVTSRYPGFEHELLKILPNMLKNVKCYNGHNHHFATEMLATEMGHLFEHIWLEVLCSEKLRY